MDEIEKDKGKKSNSKSRINELIKEINSEKEKLPNIINSKDKTLNKSTKENIDKLNKEVLNLISKLFGGEVEEDGKKVKKNGLVNELFDAMLSDPEKNFDVIVRKSEDFDKVDASKSVLFDIGDETLYKSNPFENYNGIAYIKSGKINDVNVFTWQSGIVNLNDVTIHCKSSVFYGQKGIVNLNGTKINSRDVFTSQSGIVNINSGEINSDMIFYQQYGIVNVNGGTIYGNVFSEQSGIVNMNGGTIYRDAFSEQSGIVNMNGGTIRGNAFSEQSGIVNMNEGTIIGKGTFSEQYGLAKISENAKFENSIADGMKNGFLYVMNSEVDIGDNGSIYEKYNKNYLQGGLVIAPKGAKKIYNQGATVFTVEKENSNYKNVILFSREKKIGNEVYDGEKVLKALGDYVWKNSLNVWSSEDKYKFIDSFWRFEGKPEIVDTGKIDVSNLLDGYESEKDKSNKDLGEFVYEKLTSEDGSKLVKYDWPFYF